MQYFGIKYIHHCRNYVVLPIELISSKIETVLVTTKEDFNFEKGLALIEGHSRKPLFIDLSLSGKKMDLLIEANMNILSPSKIISKDPTLLEYILVKIKQSYSMLKATQKIRGASANMIIMDDLV